MYRVVRIIGKSKVAIYNCKAFYLISIWKTGSKKNDLKKKNLAQNVDA